MQKSFCLVHPLPKLVAVRHEETTHDLNQKMTRGRVVREKK
jgi:hypothetical protein